MAFPEGHAVVVGVGTYQAAGWDAQNTVGDAAGLAEALSDEAVAGYPPAQVDLLHDGEAGRAEVLAALAALAQRAKPEDVALVFFAGHGVPGDDGQYTLATHDTQFSPGGLAQQGTGVSQAELIAALKAVKVQKLLFVLNACLSGTVGALGPAVASAPPTPAFDVRVLASGEGRAVMTAARASQSSWFAPGQTTTFFGQALIDGIRGAAADGPGYVGLFELYEYVFQSVTATAQAQGKVQEPMLNLTGGVGPFPVALYGGGPAPSPLGAAAIRTTPPAGAVETYPKAVLDAVNLTVKTSVIDFGGAHIGSVVTGDVAGRDIVKITTTAAAAAAVGTRAELMARIAGARDDVLALDPPASARGHQEDAGDDLRKAGEAAEAGDGERLLQKLEAAQRALLAMAPAAPGATDLSDAVGVLLQRARAQA